MVYTPEERHARGLTSDARWRAANREKINEYMRQYGRVWRKNNPDYQKLRLIRKNAKEAGRLPPENCEVCGAGNRKIVFDHCHQRDVFRGWICRECNIVLGIVNDDPNHLRKLIAYLERTAALVSPQLTLPGM